MSEQHRVISALHGIRTGTTDPTWPYHWQMWCYHQRFPVMVHLKHYKAKALPYWNQLVINPREAKENANWLAQDRQMLGENTRFDFIGHSNAGQICEATISLLAGRGINTHTLILTGSALESDVKKSGLFDLVQQGHLKRVICYSSGSDRVVRYLEKFPLGYGSAGAKGLCLGGDHYGLQATAYEPVDTDVTWVTRWFHRWGHSAAHDPENRARTFASFARDLGLAENRTK